MSCSGSAATTMRSASLPGSIVPSAAPTPQSPAASRVAARSACRGVAPSFTHRPQFEQRCLLERSDVRAERHPDAGRQRPLKPFAVLSGGLVGALAQVDREVALLDPSLLPRITGLFGSEVADGECGYIPTIALAQLVNALRIHHVPMLDTMRAEPHGRLHRRGVRRVCHHRETASATNRERRLQFVVEEE